MAYLGKEMTAVQAGRQATEIRLGFVFRKNTEEEEECDCGGGVGKSHH